MKKVGRNAPCTCGSGLKYKKCCGKNNVIVFNPVQLEQELEELIVELIDFSFSNFGEGLENITLDYLTKFSINADHEGEVYVKLLFPWLAINERIKNNQTIFEIFAKNRMKKIRNSQVRKAFLSWENAIMSIFEVVDIDRSEGKITACNLLENKSYKILYGDTDSLEIGTFILGTLLPLIQNGIFMFTAAEMPAHSRTRIDEILPKYNFEDGSMIELYPEILANFFSEPDQEFEWADPSYVEVANQLNYHLANKGLDEDTINDAILFWNYYCTRTQPRIMKINAYVAAMDYFVGQTIAMDYYSTQAELAKEYSVSTATISSHFQSFLYELEEIEAQANQDENFLGEPIISNRNLSFDAEKTMRDIQRNINEKDFDSFEDLEAFLNGMMINGTIDDVAPNQSAEDMAFDLIVSAQGKRGKERKKLINQALQLDPEQIDAYILLANDESNLRKRHELLLKAIKIGEKQLGPSYFNEHKGRFWGMIETRPYMRAKEQLAFLLEEMHQPNEAIKVYRELLELNPDDNQGVRSDLLRLYIEEEKFDEALSFIESFGEYPEVDFLYSHVLIHYRMKGYTPELKRLMKKAEKSNPYVVDYLTRKKKIPNARPEYIQFGGESEAIVYVQNNYYLWGGTEELLKNFI